MAQKNYLNISFGSIELEGFFNILMNPEEDPGPFSRKAIPFPDRSVHGIYSYGLIERVSQTEILIFLRECRRVLAPEGFIRISTPDIQYLVDRYNAGDWHNPLLARQQVNWVQSKAEYLNVQMRNWHRSWMCDAEELTRLAKLAGLAPRGDSCDQSDPIQQLPTTAEARIIMEFAKRKDASPETPLVSIVIPAYRSDFFVPCLDSAFAQTYSHLEIVVCDDSKTGEVEAIVESYANREIPITYVRNPSPLGEARNLTQAINLAKGYFIKPLYDDDLLTPECIEELISAILRTPDARLAACQRLPIDEDGNMLDPAILGTALAMQSTSLWGPSVIAEIVRSGVNKLGEPTVMLFRRADVLAFGEPDVMSLFGRRCAGIGDIGLALQFLSRGDLAYVAKPLAYFRLHTGQNQRQSGVDKWIASSWAYVREQAARLGLDENAVCSPPISNEADYSAWVRQKNFIPEDIGTIEKSIADLGNNAPIFQIILLADSAQDTLVANTLDSLAIQLYPSWHLDILSPLPTPDGLEEIPNIGWHFLENETNLKQSIDFLVCSGKCDWVIELPAGAKLDPLYLWRLAVLAKKSQQSLAFFVDDDLYEENGAHHSPRFKPGTNPAALLSADLAGPICFRQDIWGKIGGAKQHLGSPWFSQLVRIANQFGWPSIRHIPGILISYPGSFPSNIESCLLALVENLKKNGAEGEIIPATGQSWNIRYPLSETPNITIAILSEGQLDLLSRCLTSIIETTKYSNFEISIVLTDTQEDPDLHAELEKLVAIQPSRIRTMRTSNTGNHATRCNTALSATSNDLVLLIKEGAVVIQERWLEELVRTCQQPNISAASPCLVSPGTALIENSGNVIGLCGAVGSQYEGEAKLGDSGYLDCLRVSRDVSALSSSCMLVRTEDYLAAGGMDEITLGDYFADADLCQKLLSSGKRLIYQPLATVVHCDYSAVDNGISEVKMACVAAEKSQATNAFTTRWLKTGAVDPFFNPNLSLVKTTPTPETDYRAQWQYLPSPLPRFMARPLPNAQGVCRITSPLGALRKQGQASECIWPVEENGRELTSPELLRLSPDTVIVQHYLNDKQLAALQAWHAAPGRPFVVYALDDLVNNLAKSNPFFKNIPANSRTRLKYALERCDRLVTSTDFLAETYRHFCSDIRVVPNRLEQEIWLPLQSRKRTASKPRIGWAGGTTHQGDLVLLKEVIEQTRDEADWIFFGMCPNEIRPLLAEYHPLTEFSRYPAHLAALNLDIAVAPLAQIPFNQGKSNLRLLEYGIFGIPVVCTDIDPYRNSPACRVTNTPEAWIEALRERIHDADGREHEGATMRKWVQEHYLLENHLEEWLSAHLPSNHKQH